MLLKYYQISKTLIDNFECFEMYYIRTENNTKVDLLSKLASTEKTGHLKTIIQETLQTPTIDIEEVMVGEVEEPVRMTPYKNFLIWEVLPSDKNEARRLKWKVNYYVILDGDLFKRGLTSPLLKSLNNQQADYVIRELHEGICSLHIGGCSLATKVVCASYYWLTLSADALDFTKRCRRCQDFKDIPRTPLDNLHSLSSPWPFAMWGMDILGPLPKALGVVKYLLVVIDYFTKWIEEKPLREITTSEVEKFS